MCLFVTEEVNGCYNESVKLHASHWSAQCLKMEKYVFVMQFLWGNCCYFVIK